MGLVREGAGLSEALEEVARKVERRVGKTEAQMNMVLADGDQIGVLRSSTVLLTNSLYTSSSVPFAEDGVVLATERLTESAAWEPVDGHHRVEIGPSGLSEAELVFL